MSSRVKLYMFPGSNAVYTARLMLEHKQLDYKAVHLLPGPHAFILLAKESADSTKLRPSQSGSPNERLYRCWTVSSVVPTR